MRGQVVGQAGGVLRGLRLDAGEGAFGLGFDGAHGLAVEVEQVVREAEARLHREFAYGDAATRGQVQIVAVLHQPASRDELRVDSTPRSLFRGVYHVNF